MAQNERPDIKEPDHAILYIWLAMIGMIGVACTLMYNYLAPVTLWLYETICTI